VNEACERSQPWWELKDKDQADALCGLVAGFRTNQTQRWAQLELAMCLYDDASGLDMSVSDFSFEIVDEEQTPLNLVRSIVDTVRSEVIQERPRPSFVPAGADWSVRRKCQQLTKFCAGVLAEESWDRIASQLVIDMLVYGAAIARPVVEDGAVTIDRIPPWELWCDPDEGRYGKPRSLYLSRYAHRDVLAAQYPESEEGIREAATQLGRRRGTVGSEQVAFVEAWHLPSKKGATDGKHVICVQGEVLFEEDWNHDWFPFAMMRWKAPNQGFWGQGLALELTEVQRQLNIGTYNVEIGFENHVHTHVVASRQSGLDPEKMTDEPGKIWWHNGNGDVKALLFQPFSEHLIPWIKDLIAWGYQIASGASQAAARSEKSAGLTSGRAIQMEANLQSRRFIDPQRSFAQLHVDLGRAIVRVVEHAAATDQGLEVVYRGKNRAERIKWSKAKLDESGFVVRLDAIGQLPQSPAGRADWLLQMQASGEAERMGVPPQMMARAPDAPDVEAFQNWVSVAFDLTEDICERIVDGDDEPPPPEAFFNLSVCLLVSIVTYQQWRLWGVPEERCGVLRDWIDDVRTALERQAQAQAAPPRPPAAAGQGAAPPSPDGAPAAPPAQMAMA
jgi:hypothetical protein